jgi:probable addiction module antidote protein
LKTHSAVTEENLRDPAFAVSYLEESARKRPGGLYAALREVVQVHEGGFTWLSKQTGLGRASLYKALSEHGNPSYTTIQRVLEALGLDLSIAATYQMIKPTILNNSSVIMDKGSEVYKALPEAAPANTRILPGSAQGLVYYMAEDFNAPLDEFGDYI